MDDARTLGSNRDSTRADTEQLPESVDGPVMSLLNRKEESITIPLGRSHLSGLKNKNYIITAKYTPWSFLPKFLFEQFRRYANCFFLMIGLLQQIPDVSPTGRYVTIMPFTFILILTALKELFEDIKRHRADRKENSAKTQVYNQSTGKFQEIEWKDINVGDVLKIEDGKSFPADLILVASSEPQGISYIETSNLDGETNLKIRSSVPNTYEKFNQEENLKNFGGELQIELPNRKLYEFNGNISLSEDNGSKEPLKPDYVLLRGAKLVNTHWAYGVVIYAGHETKLLMNSTKAPLKRSNIDKVTNTQITFLFIILLVMAVASAIGSEVIKNNGDVHWYVGQGDDEVKSARNNFFFNCLTFVILYNNLIPISLLVTIEFVKLLQANFINNDAEMHYQGTDALARTSNLNEELGQIRYVFSDKTGTLTQNVMKFKECSIAGKTYAVNEDPVTVTDNDDPDSIINADNSIEHTEETKLFFTALAVCHTVIPEVGPNGETLYNASSPDEKALVEGAAEFGFTFIGRKPNIVQVQLKNGDTVEYEVLDIIEFTSARKRMSCVVRFPDGNIKLLIKGADMMINERLGKSEHHVKHLNATNHHLDDFAVKGLRTLNYAYKDISNKEYDEWKKEHKIAETAIIEREEKIDEVAAKLERDLILVGATAIEDKLQDGVPETIANLLQANIKVWILTGDKQETAINIGHSCRLLTKDTPLIILNQTSLDSTREEIVRELSKEKAAQNETEDLSLIIDGKTLIHALEQSVRQEFIDLCTRCSAVICCRVSPIQKAEMVELVQEYTQAISLAIGDGANDVAMIQKAQVGVGISGNEGLQAVNSADFAIAQFRFLQKLLFVHGAWNYTRISKVILYSFYKNICLYIIELWFAIYSYWTGQVLFERWTIGMYNVLFTGIQPIAIGLFDRDCKAETRMSNPKLYISSQNGDQFNNKVFWRWILLAVFHSVILYFVPASSWFEGLVWRNGRSGDYLVIGTIVYSCVILTVNAKAFLILDSVNIWSFLAIFGCTCFWFIFLVGYSFAWPLVSFSPEMAGMIILITQTSLFWMSLLHTPLLALLPDIFGKAVSVSVNPSITDLARLGEKKNFDPLVDKLLCGTLGRKKSKESTTEMAETQYTRQSSGRGYAFSQEEHGVKSQTEVVKSYEDQPKTSVIRARQGAPRSGKELKYNSGLVEYRVHKINSAADENDTNSSLVKISKINTNKDLALTNEETTQLQKKTF